MFTDTLRATLLMSGIKTKMSKTVTQNQRFLNMGLSIAAVFGVSLRKNAGTIPPSQTLSRFLGDSTSYCTLRLF